MRGRSHPSHQRHWGFFCAFWFTIPSIIRKVVVCDEFSLQRQFSQFQTNESRPLIKIQLWSGTRTLFARFINSVRTQYNRQISQPQTNSVTTTRRPALSIAFESQDWTVFSRTGNFDFLSLSRRQIAHTCFSLYLQLVVYKGAHSQCIGAAFLQLF